MKQEIVGDDVYLLEKGDTSLLFSPLRGSIARIKGGFDPEGLSEVIQRIENEPKTEIAKSADKANGALILTDDCQLRCTYCYSEAGKSKATMPWGIAKATVDHVVSKATNDVHFSLVGGGEPTFRWDLFTRVVAYMHEQSFKRGLKPTIIASTNGILDREQLEFITDNLSTIQVSADGPRDIQNRQRPPRSYDNVMNTIRFLEQKDFPYNVRVTVTQDSVGRLEEIFDFFYSVGNPRSVNFQPAVTTYGRGRDKGIDPQAKEFVHEFMRVKQKSAQTLRPVDHAGSRVGTIREEYCGLKDNFCVTPQGDVTSCYEVSSRDDPRSPLFFYGRFDEQSGLFLLDDRKVDALMDAKDADTEYCGDCHAQYSCAGGCYSKVAQGQDTGFQCAVNNELSFSMLDALADGGKVMTTATGMQCDVASFPDLVNDPNYIMLLCHGCPPSAPCDDHYSCSWIYTRGEEKPVMKKPMPMVLKEKD